jgi:hypothetical protein
MTTARHDPARGAPPPSFAAFVAALLALPALGCVDILGDFEPACASAECSVAWARGFGDGAKHHVAGVAIDPHDGSIFLTGAVSTALHFGDGETDPFKGISDAFVVKLDKNGSTVWARSFGSEGEDAAHAVALDSAGNVVVAGYLSGACLFDTKPDPTVVNGIGERDLFVAELSPADGSTNWVQAGLGGALADEALAITHDGLNNVLVTGYGIGMTAYGGAIDGGANAFILRLDGNGGGHLPPTGIEHGTGECIGKRIALDSDGNIVMAGTLRAGDLTVDGIASVYPVGESNLFAAAIAPEIAALHGIHTVDGNFDLGGIAIRDGGILMTGSYTGVFSLDPNKAIPVGRYNPFYVDIDLMTGDKRGFDIDGETSRRIAHSALGPDGEIYLTGMSETSPGDEDLYLLKLGPSGSVVGAQTWGEDGIQKATAVAVDPDGDVILAGDFDSSFRFGLFLLDSLEGTGMFVAKVRGKALIGGQ